MKRTAVNLWFVVCVAVAIVTIVFGIWEYIEHAYFWHVNPAIMHRLYLARGITGAFVTCSIAVWFVLVIRERAEKRYEESNRELESANRRLQMSVQELKDLQDRLVEQGKMVAIGQLATGIAHEIGNPLTSLSSVVQLMERKATDETVKGNLNLMLKHVERISKIVKQLISFARPAPYEWKPVQVNEILTEVIGLLKFDKRVKELEIKTHFQDDLPVVHGVGEQLTQVFMNMVLNSLDATDGRGTLEITTMSDEDNVKITFSDTGRGITEEELSRIFEPFYTTKPIGEGTGLGLTISQSIVEKHGGRIDVLNTKGGGAVFVITLPGKAARG